MRPTDELFLKPISGLGYPECMFRVSPTAQAFRAAFKNPLLATAETLWRWSVGAAAAAVLLFGFVEYFSSLPVSRAELLFLRTKHPYLVSQAVAHILKGSLNRAVAAALLAALLLTLLWMIACALGRATTVRSLLAYFRENAPGSVSNTERPDGFTNFIALVRINFLRVTAIMAALIAMAGAAILAGIALPGSDPQPGLAFLAFLVLAAIILLMWWVLDWILSLASIFAVRDGEDALGSISAAVSFCRAHLAAVFAVSFWTGLAHLVAFVGATMVVSMPLGLAGALPWRLVALSVILITLGYFAVADWLYVVRLAGYICIAEVPETLASVPAPNPPPPLQNTIDRNELILSDLPNLAPGT
jgi:hypothetical protein